MPITEVPYETRLLSRYEVDQETGCWNWTGTMMRVGYGQISRDGRNQPAHRAMWEYFREPIGSKLTVDHLCLNRRCVNPSHMEIVSYSENNRRRFQHREPLRTAA